jgi:K+-transporting ATPase ATPase C chain
MRRQLVPALSILLLLTVLTGLAYPLVVTGIAQAVFRDEANGSLVEREGVVVGSRLLGQAFTAPGAFHPRPSAAGHGYDAAASSGSNLGPTNAEQLAQVRDRAAAYRQENGLARDAPVPVDAVTASGSGLDPHISVANARLQAARVATARDLDVDRVLAMIDDHTDRRGFGFLGEAGVNVLALNLALDGLTP